MNERLARHERIALSFSGGKDSLACVHLLRDYLDAITIYHVDTGDLLPEMRDSVARVAAFAPRFVYIETDVADWIARHGLPTDLLPYAAHPVGYGYGQARTPLVPRYDCCWHNLMFPLFERVKTDGNTMLIRGTKRADSTRLPAYDGEIHHGIELYYPIETWSHRQVFDFLEDQGVPIPRVYENAVNSPECATCSAWWGEKRARYLKKYHPGLFEIYDARLQLVIDEVAPVLAQLRQEAEVT